MSDGHEHLPEPADDSHDGLPDLPPDDPIVNPGLPAHVWRPTDVDPHASRRA